MGEPGNTDGRARSTTSVVYYVAGDAAAQAVAASVAADMGGVHGGRDAVAAADRQPGLGTATVLVMLGTDTAGKTLADLNAGGTAPRRRPPAGATTTAGSTDGRRRLTRRRPSARREGVGGGVLDAPARLVERARSLAVARRRARPPSTPGRASRSRGDVGVGVADDHDDRPAAAGGELAHAADDLALEALGVEVALAGDDDVGGGDPLVELDVLGDEVEAARRAGRRARPARRPGRRPRRRRRAR